MKLLSIGNSFSQDAHRYLHKIAMACGYELDTVNLYIGGCSLHTHWDNLQSDVPAYALERNGGEAERKISLSEAICLENWDAVTLQQASHHSGRPQTYVPYLQELAAWVRQKCPHAKLYFHQTWAYEIGSDHPGFAYYNHDQNEMFRRIQDAARMASLLIGAPLLPVGETIQRLRETVPAFDYATGGLSLNRDSFHLSLDYGRFTAAAVWFRTLTGLPVSLQTFGQMDPGLLQEILALV